MKRDFKSSFQARVVSKLSPEDLSVCFYQLLHKGTMDNVCECLGVLSSRQHYSILDCISANNMKQLLSQVCKVPFFAHKEGLVNQNQKASQSEYLLERWTPLVVDLLYCGFRHRPFYQISIADETLKMR